MTGKETMKAAVVSKFGPIEEVLSFTDKRPVPVLRAGEGKAIVKVYSCAISVADLRMMDGSARFIRKPADGFPYVPSLDICGEIVDVDPKLAKNRKLSALVARRFGEEGLKVGQKICGTWEFWGEGGMAEYAAIKVKYLYKKPDNVDDVAGAALTHSTCFIPDILKQSRFKKSDRVLVIGGAGGTGSYLLQMLRNLREAGDISFIAATSIDTAYLEDLGVDRAIDYTKENWWEVEEFIKTKFDVIIDMGIGLKAWYKVRGNRKKSILKGRKGDGRFIAVVLLKWEINATSLPTLLWTFAAPLLRKKMYYKLCSVFAGHPRRQDFFGNPSAEENVMSIMKAVEAGTLTPALDKRGPFEFNKEGVIAAYQLLHSRHAHGKVVVNISGSK